MNNELSNLKVYYGWSKVNKIRKKVAISVVFENERNIKFDERAQRTLRRLQDTVYERKQTIAEAEDGKKQNRIFTEYSLFLKDKPFFEDLDKLLDANRQADQYNVPEIELNKIEDALRKGFKKSENNYATEN